jgi:phospholipid/cholesterol/gamma-HCH transport system substrate-binding protein
VNARMRVLTTPRGIINVALVVVLVALAVTKLLPGTTPYTADFANASGISSGDEVRVAGIPVGKVTGVSLRRGVVHVDFTADKGVAVAKGARAEIKLATILGQHYLDLVPGKGDRLDGGGTIPLAQTRSAYTIDKFQVDANNAVQTIDDKALATAVDTLTHNLDGNPDTTRQALQGIAQVSHTVASRDDELRRLISSTRTVTDVVHGQQGNLMRILGDSDKVAAMINERRETIQLLLRSTRSMVHEVTLLVRDNSRQLRPTLLQLKELMGTLVANKDYLDRTLKAVTAQSRYFANATGNGPWIEVFAPDFLITDNVFCAITSPAECK